jgi:hypothetical protein
MEKRKGGYLIILVAANMLTHQEDKSRKVYLFAIRLKSERINQSFMTEL